MLSLQVAFQFPDKPSRNGAQPPVRLQGLAAVFRMVAETLVPGNLLEGESVALAQGKVKGFHDGQHLADNLFMQQLRIRGVSHVLSFVMRFRSFAYGHDTFLYLQLMLNNPPAPCTLPRYWEIITTFALKYFDRV